MKLNRKLLSLVWAVLLVSLTVVVATAQGTPTARFTGPAANATVMGPDVTVSWESTGVTIAAAADAKQLSEGHYHLFLDKDPNLQDGVEIPRGDLQIIHTAAKEYKWANVPAGKHTVTVVVSYSDHKPWIPRAVATLSFTVAPATLPKTGAEQTTEWLWIAGALVLASLAVFALNRKLRAMR